MPLSKHVHRFAEGTSMHGFRNVILSKRPQKRIAWFIVFLCAWTLFAYQITSVVTRYFQYPKRTVTQVVAGGVPFPAVTLCNMEGFNSFAAQNIANNMRNIMFPSTGPIAQNDSLIQEISKYFDIILTRNNARRLERAQLRKLASRTTVAANLKHDTKIKSALSKEQFIVDCFFAGKKCKKITTTFDPYYFNCFTFEPPQPKTYDRKANEYSQSLSEGIDSGFSATVLTGTYLSGNSFTKSVLSYFGVLDTSVGIRVIIHPPGTQPFPLDEGYDVPPDRTASLAITPGRRIRLKEPYGRCTDEYQVRKGQSLFAVTQNETRKYGVYRKLQCERNCIQEQVVENCSCLDEMLPIPMDTTCFENNTCTIDHLKSQMHVKRVSKSRSSKTDFLNECRGAALVNCADRGNRTYDCGERDITASLLQRISCAENITTQYMTDVSLLSSCGCHPPCNEYLYDVAYSLAKWPPSDLRGTIWLDSLVRNNKEFVSSYPNWTALESKNFAKINVYVKDSNVLLTEEREEISFVQLLSEIGGQLGLWIGVSVITVSEVLEILLTLSTEFFRKLCCKRKQVHEADSVSKCEDV